MISLPICRREVSFFVLCVCRCFSFLNHVYTLQKRNLTEHTAGNLFRLNENILCFDHHCHSVCFAWYICIHLCVCVCVCVCDVCVCVCVCVCDVCVCV